MHRRFFLAATLSGGLLAVAPATALSDNNGQTLTFKELDKGATFKFIDNPPRARNPRRPRPGAGDEFVIGNPLASASGAKRGVLRAVCTFTTSKAALCVGTFALKEGTLAALVSTNNINSTTTTGIITGGTGPYAGARGTFNSVQTKTGSNDTVTLL